MREGAGRWRREGRWRRRPAPLPPEPNLNCAASPRARHQRGPSPRAPLAVPARRPIVEPLRPPPRQSGRGLLRAGRSARRRAALLARGRRVPPSPRFVAASPGGAAAAAAMPEFLADPSVLTKEKLKSELIANNVSLPGGEQRKDVYVQLYLQHLTARNPPAAAQPDFSSDEEREPTPLGPRGRGAAAAGRVSAAPRRASRPHGARPPLPRRPLEARGRSPGLRGEKRGRLGPPRAVWGGPGPPGEPRGSGGCASGPTWKGEAAEGSGVLGLWGGRPLTGAASPVRPSTLLCSSAAARRAARQPLHAFPRPRF